MKLRSDLVRPDVHRQGVRFSCRCHGQRRAIGVSYHVKDAFDYPANRCFGTNLDGSPWFNADPIPNQ